MSLWSHLGNNFLTGIRINSSVELIAGPISQLQVENAILFQ